MCALVGGVPGPAQDRLGVPGEVADAGIDLVEGEAESGHPASLIVFLTQWGVGGVPAVLRACDGRAGRDPPGRPPRACPGPPAAPPRARSRAAAAYFFR
ncbi:hypothetical protein San01_72210 [Streptomyces angustmyceticus]|uniref:Uncharacterized protein n=1 Tax=Streptomyces angustmyceticus TaxID=285578 RepID=A0A5J4LKU9_9ACTN|nr:hypothetical protein San01_72210 [Streptomyces angustmyceticus]